MSHGVFLTQLSTYLQRLTEPHKSREQEGEPIVVDPAWAQSVLLRTLERVEQGESSDRHHQKRAAQYLQEWQYQDRIITFVRELIRLLRHGLAASEPEEQVKGLVELGLARWLDLPGELQTQVRTAELDRLVAEANKFAFNPNPSIHRAKFDVAHYAASNQLVTRKEGRVQISSLGQQFLEHQGREAVRFLLRVEVQLALGPLDPDRLSRGAASAMLSKRSWHDDGESEEVLCAGSTETRLLDLGVLDEEEYGPNLCVTNVTPLGQELLGELVNPEKPPVTLISESVFSGAIPGTEQLSGKPTTYSLRKLMQGVLRVNDDLNTFCIDHFPEVVRRFSSEMTREARENLLLQLQGTEEILAALRLHAAESVERHGHILKYA